MLSLQWLHTILHFNAFFELIIEILVKSFSNKSYRKCYHPKTLIYRLQWWTSLTPTIFSHAQKHPWAHLDILNIDVLGKLGQHYQVDEVLRKFSSTRLHRGLGIEHKFFTNPWTAAEWSQLVLAIYYAKLPSQRTAPIQISCVRH